MANPRKKSLARQQFAFRAAVFMRVIVVRRKNPKRPPLLRLNQNRQNPRLAVAEIEVGAHQKLNKERVFLRKK